MRFPRESRFTFSHVARGRALSRVPLAIILPIVLTVFGSIAETARADDITLDQQTHREVWHSSSSGDVVKDFEWSVKPTISLQSGVLVVQLNENLTKHADGFAGVTGEIEFSNDAFQSMDIQFTDGSTQTVQSSEARLEGDAAGKTVAKIVAHFDLVGRQWTMTWDATAGLAAERVKLPDDWTNATTDLPPSGTASTGSTPQKGTWLTPTEMKDRPQDLDGIWRETDGDQPGQGDAQWFHHLDNKLTVGLLSERLSTSWVRVSNVADSNRWTGDGAPPGQDGTGFSICPNPKGTCTQLCKWAAGSLDIEPGALHITGEWHDKHVDSIHCTFTDEPQTQPLIFDRFIGTSFAPIKAGKYLYLGMAPAVGSEPAQFKALVRMTTDYSGTGAVDVKSSVDPATATLMHAGGDATKATYEFSTRGHGTFEVTFALVDKDGAVFHTDRLRIEIPTVPGIGN